MLLHSQTLSISTATTDSYMYSTSAVHRCTAHMRTAELCDDGLLTHQYSYWMQLSELSYAHRYGNRSSAVLDLSSGCVVYTSRCCSAPAELFIKVYIVHMRSNNLKLITETASTQALRCEHVKRTSCSRICVINECLCNCNLVVLWVIAYLCDTV
eukprot:1360-Heterococcus_DN1.PRE.1